MESSPGNYATNTFEVNVKTSLGDFLKEKLERPQLNKNWEQQKEQMSDLLTNQYEKLIEFHIPTTTYVEIKLSKLEVSAIWMMLQNSKQLKQMGQLHVDCNYSTVPAIKAIREQYGCGLREAKEIVDWIASRPTNPGR